MEIRPHGCTEEEWTHIQALDNLDFKVRDNAAGALQALDADCAVPALLRLLERETHEGVRGSVAYYIGYLCEYGDGEHDVLALEVFRRLLESESSQNVKGEIADAMDRIGDRDR